MTAYAALVSLITTLEHIQNHPRLPYAFNKKQIQSLAEKICFLLDFVEADSPGEAEADLETQIVSAARAAEDVIEAHVVDQIHVAAAGSFISLLDLQTIIEEIGCIKEKVYKFIQGKESKPTYLIHDENFDELEPEEKVTENVASSDVEQMTCSMNATSLTPPKWTTNTTMIGFEDELTQLMEMLIGRQSSLQIIPVHGMGGIGKTTLAKNTYVNPTVVQQFDIRAWVTVSQTYNAKSILLELLNSCQHRSPNDTYAEDYELGEKLHKILWGRRYLIMLDDVWSVEAWEKIMFFFPDSYNRSRIVVTTRLSNMAAHFGSSCLTMNLLDEEKSWDLFCEKAFVQQGGIPPPKIEKIGKDIAKKCKGLPLSITVIGGLLGKSSMTQEYWESVGDDINSILNSGDDEHCLNILSLSYTHLPVHLKPCFLYVGVFPEDHEIRVSRLIKLWVAEGFLKPNETQSLEEIANSYIIDLIGRNLILALKWNVSGKLKSCILHDLLRDQCLRIAEKEKFLRVINSFGNIPVDMARDRRLVFALPSASLIYYLIPGHDALPSASLARSLFYGNDPHMSLHAPFKFRLLRVLDGVYTDNHEIPSQQVNLRYLEFKGIPRSELSSLIFMLWNLQTFICKLGNFVAPLEIWEMPQLRYLECRRINLPDPPRHGLVLRNLQTLKTVVNMRLGEKLCQRITNLKRLGLFYADDEFDGDYYCLGNLDQLDKLESLNLSFSARVPNRNDILHYLKLPSSLQKLTLGGCELGWDDLAVIGCLPNLQVLKLGFKSVVGSDWNTIEGQFLGLKYLTIRLCESLIRWNADCSHFPVLEKLHLEGLSELEEIPLGLGEIPTLELIHLSRFSESCAISALKILEEQENQGNAEGLQVRLQFWEKAKMQSFKEKVVLSKNVHIKLFDRL